MRPFSQQVSFPEVEQEILADWETQQTFAAQEASRRTAKEFSFFDGPPFANGLPHYGHLLASTIKDIVPRYWVMKGFKVRRRFGWDCHGLPVEFEVEKQHNLKGRPDILKMGVHEFNETCRESVQRYVDEWRKTITRLGRWVDWDDQYRTMDKDFMESVWWVFSELFRKNLIYQDFKVVPFSPRTSSVVSNFEANQNYKDVQDPSIVAKFKVKSETNLWLLAWTTTPWTLPSNLALGVGEAIEYVRIKDHKTTEEYLLAKERLVFLYPPNKKAQADNPAYTILSSVKGTDLKGLEYDPLFPYFAGRENAFHVLIANFVRTDNGTGIVHLAPAFGEDDFFACRENGIKLVDPIDENGCFTDDVWDYKGLLFKDADKTIIRDLKSRNQIALHDTIVHSYPFDERTDTPLMYKAVPSWYVRVESMVDDLLANNNTINWVPDHIRQGRMGSWLANARDWSISRNRFWGTPLPVWVCEKNSEHFTVIGSVKELETLSGKKVHDLHKHHLKDVTIQCKTCAGTQHVVDVVFDCWFESGAMPYAQFHYPFENKEAFARIFPADFIGEGLDQTRGWFYTLAVLGTALFNKPAFKNVIVNGVILDEGGKKMSKRHRNYTPPDDLMNKYGADSVRLYMINSPLLRAEDLIFSDLGVREVTRSVLLPLWNAYGFLYTYSQAEKWQPDAHQAQGDCVQSTNEMDRWILSRLQSLVAAVSAHMEEYRLYLVVPKILAFVEDLTNWYIRLSRRRFWGTTESGGSLTNDQRAAFETLYVVLLNFSKVLAPFAPFISDHIYKNLVDGIKGVPQSVHLCDFPVYESSVVDPELETRMDLLQKVVSLGRALRQKHKLKVRQALPSITVITGNPGDQDTVTRGTAILLQELNVKEVRFTTDEADHLKLSIRPNLRTLGKKIGKDLPKIKAAFDHLNTDNKLVAQKLLELKRQGTLEFSGYPLTLDDVLIERTPLEDGLLETEGQVTVLLETDLNDALVREGWAREVINRIQRLRKESGLQVSDRVRMQVLGTAALLDAIEDHKEHIGAETLAVDIEILQDGGECSLRHIENCVIDGMPCVIALEPR